MTNQLIVKYHNSLNDIDLTSLSAPELNLFIALCAKLRDRGTDVLVIPFTEIRNIAGFWSNKNDILAEALKTTNAKLRKIDCHIETEQYDIQFNIFSAFIIDKINYTLTVSVDPKLSFLLNALTKNFTKFELSEFVHLDGRYAKHLYMLFKRFRTTGIVTIKAEDFRRKLGIPDTYTSSDIMQKVIKPTLKVLKNAFQDLTVETLQSKQRGRRTIGYKFKFTAEPIQTIEQPTEQDKQEQSVPKLPHLQTSKLSRPTRKGSFFALEERQYDYASLEKDLLKAQQRNSEEIRNILNDTDVKQKGKGTICDNES